MNLQNIKDEIGVRFFGYNLNIDLISACPLRCPTCSVAWIKGDGAIMPFERFVAILDKAQSEFKIRRFGPYLWSDPLLLPDLPRYIREVKRRDIFVMLSTTLNKINCDLKELMASGIDDMRISWSGWDHYSEHHRGGDCKVAVQNMVRISQFTKRPKRITLLFHRYKDNLHEQRAGGFLAQHLGFGYDPFDAQFLSLEKLVEGGWTAEDHATIMGLLNTPQELATQWQGQQNCYLQRKCIQLDAHGEIMLCCNLKSPAFHLGDFLTTPFKDMRRQVLRHPFCQKCMAMGISQYTLIRDSSLAKE
jgi:hypothetical protein